MTTVDQVLRSMIEFDKGDKARINHFLKVHSYAMMIGKAENLSEREQYTLEVAAAVHDIPIHFCEKKYGDDSGRHQEIEGPAIARVFLEKLEVDAETIDRVCFLVGHHHTYTGIDKMDYQILVEADFLVNLDENGSNMETIQNVKKNIFQTKSGKMILEQLFEM